MNTSSAIRLTRTTAVERALALARERYPALDDREIFKLGLSKLVTDDTLEPTPYLEEIMRQADDDIKHGRTHGPFATTDEMFATRKQANTTNSTK